MIPHPLKAARTHGPSSRSALRAHNIYFLADYYPQPYLEAQTEAIVYAIQSVLSGVRSPVPPLTLNENVTQIITIVSSIVSVCRGNLPPGSAQQAAELLRELGEHARKLSE